MGMKTGKEEWTCEKKYFSAMVLDAQYVRKCFTLTRCK